MRFRVEEVELRHSALRPGVRPLSFAHISDLHLRRWGSEHESLVETINGRALDFVFVTGDILTDRPASMECAARLFALLRCRHGLFAVRGNCEVTLGPPLRRLRPMMAGWGARLLANESQVVTTRAGQVRVMGLDDLNLGSADIEAALESSPQRGEFSVLLCHSPLAAALLPPGPAVDLVLSGHTHGGQVRLPLLWRHLLPHGHGGFTDGLYELGGLKLYVNRGFGSVGIVPLRLNCPAEVAFFRVLPLAR